MKKFLKIILFGILTLSLISISDTKINYLNNNNEVEKVKSLRKNVNGVVNSWDQINSYEDLNNVELISKAYDNNLTWLYTGSVSTKGEYYKQSHSIEICEQYYTNSSGSVYYPNNYNNLNGSSLFDFENPHDIRIGLNQGGTTFNVMTSMYITRIKFKNLYTEYINYDFSKFKKNLMVFLDIYTDPQTFIKVDIQNENIINNINYVEVNYSTSSNNYSLKTDINNALNISRYIDSGINDLTIKIKYIQLPKYYGTFKLTNPGFLSVQTTDNNVKESVIKLIKDDISYNHKNEIFNISLNEAIPTINLLTNTTWFLNPLLSFDYTNINRLEILPTDTAIQGYYIAYNFNVNEVINEYMYFNDDKYPNDYKFLVNLGTPKLTDRNMVFYDNHNTDEKGNTLTSGKYIYNFKTNGYYDQYGVVPRIISFSYLFNTNNLYEEIVYNESATNTASFYFYDFIINNATEFTTEQYDTYNSGYNIGYNVGVDFGTTSTKWIQSVFGAVDDILQVEILPNFKLWYLIGIPLLFSAVIFVFKILR